MSNYTTGIIIPPVNQLEKAFLPYSAIKHYWGVYKMAEYLARIIIDGVLKYSQVIAKKPDLKDAIDTILISVGRETLIG